MLAPDGAREPGAPGRGLLVLAIGRLNRHRLRRPAHSRTGPAGRSPRPFETAPSLVPLPPGPRPRSSSENERRRMATAPANSRTKLQKSSKSEKCRLTSISSIRTSLNPARRRSSRKPSGVGQREHASRDLRVDVFRIDHTELGIPDAQLLGRSLGPSTIAGGRSVEISRPLSPINRAAASPVSPVPAPSSRMVLPGRGSSWATIQSAIPCENSRRYSRRRSQPGAMASHSTGALRRTWSSL
jgi:hypothetical protein